MTTPTTGEMNPENSQLFQLAAHRADPHRENRTQSSPAITEKTFAELRREAENSRAATDRSSRRAASNNSRVTFSLDSVRSAVFVHTLQRKLYAEEIFRPVF